MAKGAIKAVIATQYEGSGLKKAQKDIGAFGKSMKGLLGTIGVATSIGALVSQLDQAGRAAAADAKSQALLALAMQNTVGATQGQIIETEKSIQKFSSLYGIMDDNIRPAMAQFVRVTGDVTKATELTNLALNVAAGTGRDLSAVTIALGKAYQGNTASLAKLGLNVKGLKDPLGALAQQFAGAAEAAANTDPYQRIAVAMDNTKEAIGAALLPAMNQLADFLNSDAFTAGVANVANDFNNLVSGLLVVVDDISGIVTQINTVLGNIGAGVNLGQFFDFIARITPGINLLRGLIGLGKEANAKAAVTDETSRLIQRRLDSLGALGGNNTPAANKVSGTTKKLTADTSALTKAVDAAKAAFDAKVKAYQEAVAAAQAVIDSTKEMTAGFVALFKVTPQMGEFETKVVDGFDAIYEKIKSTLADKRILQASADALTKYADSILATLRSLAKQQDVLAQKIDIARTITSGVTGLANLTGMLDSITQSVTETTRSMSNGIETIMTKTFDVTKTGGIVDNFKALVDKTKAFAKNLIDLKKLGLNKNLFAQLVQAGADAGGATAQALVDGGADTITALNDLYGQLDDTAAVIAETSTQTLYDVGQQVVTNGFIEGLVSQQDALVAAAQTLAKSFADAFNTQMAAALQIALPPMPVESPAQAITTRPDPTRSPQRYAAWLAGIGGIDPIRSPQSYAAAQAAKNTTLNVTVNAGLGTNGTTVAQDIVNTLKQYERVNGSVWQSA